MADSLLQTTLSFESAEMNHFGTATILTRLTTDIGSIRRSLQMTASLLHCPLLVIFSVIAAFRIHHGLSLIFLLAIAVLTALLFLIITRSRFHTRRMLSHYDEMNQMLSEDIRGMRTVKSFARELDLEERFSRVAGDLRTESQAAERMSALNNPFSKMVVNLSVLALVWLGGKQVISENLEIGDLFCLITYTNQILAQVLVISMVLVPMVTSQVSLRRILETLDYQGAKKTEGTVETVASGSVSFRNVNFSYGERENGRPLLKDISFSVPEGMFLGITGTSGSGKTTLLKLLMGLYQPASGTVCIGDLDCSAYRSEALRAAFTEYEINIRGHFFSDGCGKSSIASAAWVLMLRNHPLPVYKGGYRAFYAYEPPFRKGSRPEEEEKAFYERFLNWYRGLF